MGSKPSLDRRFQLRRFPPRASMVWARAIFGGGLLAAMLIPQPVWAEQISSPARQLPAIDTSLAAGTRFFTSSARDDARFARSPGRPETSQAYRPVSQQEKLSVAPANNAPPEFVPSAIDEADWGASVQPASACPHCQGHVHGHGGISLPPWLRGNPPFFEGERYLGWGRPLITSSWRNRPGSASAFVGGIFAEGLIPGQVDQGSGVFLGARIGWDLDHYLGTEARFGLGYPEIKYAPTAGLPGDTGRIMLGDLSLLYYPWGDARWRPYLLWGLGVAVFDFTDHLGRPTNQAAFGMPIGIGVKYRWDERIALRAELLDNIAFGSGGGLETMNNFSLTMGAEYRFGGKRPSYWPWHPSRFLAHHDN